MVYVTCKDKKEAIKISKHLINKKLIACSNYFPINSIYRWKGKIVVDDKEYVIILKTLNKNYNKLKKEIKKIHSYKIPFIGKINLIINEEYKKYINEEVK